MLVIESGRILKVMLKVQMSTLKSDLDSICHAKCAENNEAEDIAIDGNSIVLDKYEIGPVLGVGGYGS